MSTMDNKRNYRDDLAGIRGIPLNPKDTPFIVPTGYFNTLENSIIQRIHVISDTEQSFKVPEQYFESLGERILAKIEREGLHAEVDNSSHDNLESFIEKLKEDASAPGFFAPPNYFDGLSQKITQAVADLKEEEEPKEIILPTRRKKLTLSWISYAAAACLLIGLGVYSFFQYQSNNFDHRLKSIPANEIVNYLEYYSEPGDAAFLEVQFDDVIQMDKPKFSEEDIEAYLDYSI